MKSLSETTEEERMFLNAQRRKGFRKESQDGDGCG